jgi:hypothetical protein
MTGETLDKAITETAQMTSDVVKTGVKVTEAAVKKAWSIMDAASEKRAPSEYLSQHAIKAIQGIAQPGEK